MTTKKTEPEKAKQIDEVLHTVYDALKTKGYDSINQLVGFIFSDDPTYITTYNNARKLITSIDREETLKYLIEHYFKY